MEAVQTAHWTINQLLRVGVIDSYRHGLWHNLLEEVPVVRSYPRFFSVLVQYSTKDLIWCDLFHNKKTHLKSSLSVVPPWEIPLSRNQRAQVKFNFPQRSRIAF